MKILDCTLRDGGYYTNWDFDKDTVTTYFESFNNLPVDYLEIGYRSQPMKEYFGEFFYCPINVIESVKKLSHKKLVIILNEKDVRAEDAEALLKPCKGLIDMVRLAIDPKQFKRALGLAAAVKKMGFEVGFNVMYMSSWAAQGDFLQLVREVTGLADYFYMVDSYGGVYPQDVQNTYNLIRAQTEVKIGFHGHNNLELGLINTLTAMECGAEIVDVTVTGMGRGAGNLKTELLLTALNAKGTVEFDFNVLSKVVDPFVKLQEKFQWGTNLPYMVSGANSLPQKDVMEWVSNRYYSFNSIIRALSNQSKGVKDNLQLPKLDFGSEKKYKSALIIGGGPSAVGHSGALHQFLAMNPETVVIHASSKNALSFENIKNSQYFCLVGNEGHRLEQVFGNVADIEGKCILPPFPRKMGTYIPKALEQRAYELNHIDFTDRYQDSHTALALQTARELGVSDLYISGYDGYAGSSIGQKEQDLFMENEYLFQKIKELKVNCLSLTPTNYKNLTPRSVYSMI